MGILASSAACATDTFATDGSKCVAVAADELRALRKATELCARAESLQVVNRITTRIILESHRVTPRHTASRRVTPRHIASHRVKPRHTLPSPLPPRTPPPNPCPCPPHPIPALTPSPNPSPCPTPPNPPITSFLIRIIRIIPSVLPALPA